MLDRLVADKLAPIVTEVSGEGWSWVEALADLDYESLAAFSRRYPEQAALSESDQAELDQLTAEYDALADDEDADSERLDQIEKRIDELNASGETWPAETLSLAGAVVGLGYEGSVLIERGLVRATDKRKASKTKNASSGEAGASESALPATLVEDLTAQRSAAIGAELIRQPDIALAAVVHALVLNAFYLDSRADSCLASHVGHNLDRK